MSALKHKTRKAADLQKLPIIGKQPKNEKEEKHLKEIHEYEFNNIEEQGLSNTFSYGDGKNQHVFKFFHGGKYKVPRFVARHVENCTTPKYDWVPDGRGNMVPTFVGNIARFQMRESFEG